MTSLPYSADRFLVVDDEKEHIQFLPDFLKAKGFEVDIATSAGDAQKMYLNRTYRGYIIDLNIPLGPYEAARPLSSAQNEYKGLRVIQDVRSQGVSGARVLAYSAHENGLIKSEIDRMYCGYEVKGRVRELKGKISTMLVRDPVAEKVGGR